MIKKKLWPWYQKFWGLCRTVQVPLWIARACQLWWLIEIWTQKMYILREMWPKYLQQEEDASLEEEDRDEGGYCSEHFQCQRIDINLLCTWDFLVIVIMVAHHFIMLAPEQSQCQRIDINLLCTWVSRHFKLAKDSGKIKFNPPPYIAIMYAIVWMSTFFASEYLSSFWLFSWPHRIHNQQRVSRWDVQLSM